MIKRVILAVVAVFVAWSALEFIVHWVMLCSTYEATADLWRPMDEMNMGLMQVVGFVVAAVFVCIYAYLVRPRSLATGLTYGLLWGLGAGVSMGYGIYCVMPIPHHLALAWCLCAIAEGVVGGVLVAFIVKEKENR